MIYISTIATEAFIILVLFTVPVYHVVLFLRYLVLVERLRDFSSDILVPFQDSNNLYGCVEKENKSAK